MVNSVENVLQLGTVVSLDNFDERIMIIGYSSNVDDGFDYYGCVYPDGFSDIESIICFSNDEIDSIYNVNLDKEIEEKNESITEYEFDEEGNVVTEDGLAVTGLGIKFEEDEVEEDSEYEFDEEGNVVTEDGLAVTGLGFEFEEDEVEEDSEYEFDEEGNVVTEDGLAVTGLGFEFEEDKIEEDEIDVESIDVNGLDISFEETDDLNLEDDSSKGEDQDSTIIEKNTEELEEELNINN